MFSINGTNLLAQKVIMQVFFFPENWSVGADVVSAVLSFFENDSLLRGINATALTLIPKTNCPQILKEYRPIACCNVIYKCIPKV